MSPRISKPPKSSVFVIDMANTNMKFSSTKMKYSGPISVKGSKNEVETAVLVSSQAVELTSTSAGLIAPVFGSWPSGIGDWSSIQATWHEVRTLGVEAVFVPSNRYSKTTTVTRPIISVIDHTDPGVLGSYSIAANHSSAAYHTLDDPFRFEAKMDGAEEAQFQDVNTAPAGGNRFYLKLYADGLSFSVAYGIVFLKYLYQVRGRK